MEKAAITYQMTDFGKNVPLQTFGSCVRDEKAKMHHNALMLYGQPLNLCD